MKASNRRPWTSENGLEEVLDEMDAKRKHWKEKLFAPCFTAQDILGEPSQLEPSEQIASCKGKKTGGIHHLSSKKFQEENKSKRKEFTPQQNEKEPNLRERKVRLSKNSANKRVAAHKSPSYDASLEERSNIKEDCATWIRKELSTPPHQESRKKITKGMSTKCRLNILNEELEELNMKCRKIEEEFEIAEKELMTSKRDVSPTTLNFEETEVRTLTRDWELHTLRNDLSEETTNVQSLTEELQRAKEMIHKLSLENSDLKEMVRKLKRETEVGRALIKEELKLQYELEVDKIRGEVDAIKNDLRSEKTLQARNNRALELLRNHFVSTSSGARDRYQLDFF
ncbi:PREDICTED: coiled-coil domain-containing protein 160 [Condylura cristata]|uniref:coiled-coil domain-containing protein 160 n=1 Tax=Condylura cristata TaxID=143302 RepID=UPI000643BD91|nr:PREDICTED: coiled-coil domain-containing protein 160 [Condylura cristata]